MSATLIVLSCSDHFDVESLGALAPDRAVICLGDAGQALASLRKPGVAGLLIDARDAAQTAADMAALIADAAPKPVIVWLSRPEDEEAAAWFENGVIEILTAGMDAMELRQRVDRALAGDSFYVQAPAADTATSAEPWRERLVGESWAMKTIAQMVRLVSPRRATVLITGETGSGKEVVARALHEAGPRAAFPLISVNCSALPEELLEAELFGHVKGAFTGAVASRIGRFELAHRGTLFLDEIGDMPLSLQAKLLRVLQEREFQRVGSSETVKVDVRVVAASNADLAAKVRKGEFREDLYYRLRVVPIQVPPLRERKDDIALLAQHFLKKICEAEGLPQKRFVGDVLQRLSSYDWPGNVRQLENVIEMAVALSGARPILQDCDFPILVNGLEPEAEAVMPPDETIEFEHFVGCFERKLIEYALRQTNGNKKSAADLLRLKRTTFYYKLRSLNIALGGEDVEEEAERAAHAVA